MSYILLVFYLSLLITFIVKANFFKVQGISRFVVSIIFVAKFIAGILVFVVYQYYYNARLNSDIFKYFDDGNIIYSALSQNPLDYLRMVTGIDAGSPHLVKYYDTCHFWFKEFNYNLVNDNRVVIRFNAIIRLISMGNMHIHTLFMSFLSFSGLWAIFKTFKAVCNIKNLYLILIVFFFPSVYFWTSGLLKEGILMFALGFLIYGVYLLCNQKISAKTIIIIVLSICMLLISKFYVLVAIFPALLFITIKPMFKNGKSILIYIIIHIAFFTFAFIPNPFTNSSFAQILANKQNDFIKYTNSLSIVGSKINIEPIKPTVTNILSNSPKAFITTLLRPHIFEPKNPMMLMAAFENLLILILLALAIIYFKLGALKNIWFWGGISFVIILFTLSGITTPILGALVRYKAPALPFLGFVLLLCTDISKIESKIISLKIWKKLRS